jgi:hypothetical protein
VKPASSKMVALRSAAAARITFLLAPVSSSTHLRYERRAGLGDRRLGRELVGTGRCHRSPVRESRGPDPRPPALGQDLAVSASSPWRTSADPAGRPPPSCCVRRMSRTLRQSHLRRPRPTEHDAARTTPRQAGAAGGKRPASWDLERTPYLLENDGDGFWSHSPCRQAWAIMSFCRTPASYSCQRSRHRRCTSSPRWIGRLREWRRGRRLRWHPANR